MKLSSADSNNIQEFLLCNERRGLIGIIFSEALIHNEDPLKKTIHGNAKGRFW